MRSAELKPCLPASLFPLSLSEQPSGLQSETVKRNKMESTSVQVKVEQPISLDEFIDSEIDDDDLIGAGTSLTVPVHIASWLKFLTSLS